MRVTIGPWIAVLLVLVQVSRWAHADDFSAGVDAYDRGDYEEAFILWQSFANQGDPRAQYRLGQMYATGIGVRQDVGAALHWTRRAAEQGVVEARYDLALRYSLGRGVRADAAQAAHWYGLLAEDGHATAQDLLGGMYEDGQGVEKDAARAAYWYQRAAEQGYVESQVKLGVMYSQGRGVPKDPGQAWAWFDVAAARGHGGAAEERANLRLGEEELARAERLSRELRPGAPAVPPGEREAEAEAEAEAETEAETKPAAVPRLQMVRIKSGCFEMGSEPAEAGRHENEDRRSACVESFTISRYETTRGQYAAFVASTGRETPDGCQVYGDGAWGSRAGRSWRDPGYAQDDEHPVACVSRDDALAFARWLSERTGRSYRLPTEAEWEYATRAGIGGARPWGDEPRDACLWANVGDLALRRYYPEWVWTIHVCDDEFAHTAPVGSFRTNPHGLYDMLGNVWEWTCSAYDARYRGMEHRCASNPGAGVVRGGSWSNSPRWVRSAARFESGIDARFDIVGFRLAHD